jgi:hypothetical protein
MRVTVTHVRNVVVHVEVFPVVGIVQPDPFTADEVHGVVVE